MIFAEWLLENYEGGDNPILAYLFLGSVISLVVGLIALAFWQTYQRVRFDRSCESLGLSKEELGIIKSFVRRFRVKKRERILSQIRSYDVFMNKVSHHYESQRLSEEDIVREVAVFEGIREKLHLSHKFELIPLLSSRALPIDHPITVVMKDSDSKHSFTFQSKIISNHDFYLGIQPPDASMHKELPRMKGKPLLRITFDKKNDVEYQFESILVRVVNHPHQMWYARHAAELVRCDVKNELSLPATVMVTSESENCDGQEIPVIILSFNNKECVFSLENTETTFKAKSNALISFSIEEKNFTWNGVITDQIQRLEKILYRLKFKGIAETELINVLKLVKNSKSATGGGTLLTETIKLETP